MSNVDYRLCHRDIASNDTASTGRNPLVAAPVLVGFALSLELWTLAITLGRLAIEAATRV